LADVSHNRRVVGLSDLSSLRAVPRVMAIAGNLVKAPAILGALRGRFFNVLVTDALAAAEVLALEQRDRRG
jgi:DNA-binding transcriptional regulator LsrR (DeoR family)